MMNGTAKDRKKAVKNSVLNREFAVVTYFFLAIFLSIIAYFAYFQIKESEQFINSPYNSRQDTFADRIIRGDIVSGGGDVLATTKVAEDGTETRSYPYGNLFAHAVGYSTNGKTGIESIANFELLRSHAFFLEKIANDVRDKKNRGDTIVTTLDTSVQTAAYQALGSNRGAVVAIQPSTGKILAMVSKPDFDPNTIAQDWSRITAEDNTDSVLLNRATQGLYPPGSTFKILTTLAYMQQDKKYRDYSYQCAGSITKDGASLHCFNGEVHGTESLRESFAHSCNTSYANIGLSLNITKFRSLCKSLLFDSELPCDFPYKESSFSLKRGATAWETMQTAIGQGKTLMTPYHLALIASAADYGGVLMKPYLIDRVTNYSGTDVVTNEPELYARLLSEKESQVLKAYMQDTVEYGTATSLKGQSYTAGGKTGSAEFTSEKNSHAWFAGYASKEGYEDIAVAVIVEGAGTGGAYAVPVAKAVFDAYFL